MVLILMLVILVLCCVVVLALLSGIINVWVSHRVRLTLLDYFQKNPDHLTQPDDIHAMLERVRPESSQDFRLTGAILVLLGVGGILAGQSIGTGLFAVGIYTGGVLSIVLGLLISLLGILMRAVGPYSRRKG